jgi:hypothetical protein
MEADGDTPPPPSPFVDDTESEEVAAFPQPKQVMRRPHNMMDRRTQPISDFINPLAPFLADVPL